MYTLVKKNNKFKTDSILELYGYSTRINKVSIVVYNQRIIDLLIKNKVVPELNKLIKKVLIVIEEDGSDGGSEPLLDELARLYSTFVNEYEKHLSKYEINEFKKNIRLLTNELKSLSYKKRKTVAAVSHSKQR